MTILRSFGLNQGFLKGCMTSSHSDELKDEVLTEQEVAKFTKFAQNMIDSYSEHMRKVNQK